MGLFDRLFGKKEEPKIEEVVKEALENLDLSEDVDPTFTEVDEVPQEEAEVEIVEQAVFQEEEIQDTVEESLDSEPVVGFLKKKSKNFHTQKNYQRKRSLITKEL